MNQTIELINHRKSTRSYSSEGLTQEEKNTILHSAMRAPTGGNMMLYSIIEVDDQRIKDQLAESCDHQPFIAKAPYVLLFLADYQRFFDLFTFAEVESACQQKGVAPRNPEEGDLLMACCDAMIAAQTAVIAAESMGIGSCYIGDILENAATHRELFDLPLYTLPLSLICFGRPKVENGEGRITPRYDQQFVVFKNRYHRLGSDEFLQMMNATASKNFPELSVEDAVKSMAQNIYFRKFACDFSVEMSRSSREWISQWNGKPGAG